MSADVYEYRTSCGRIGRVDDGPVPHAVGCDGCQTTLAPTQEPPTPRPSPAADYAAIGAELGRLVATKQKAYGDSFGKSGEVMRILYPSGIQLGQFDDALTVVRVLDKLFRVATARDALGESPWRDIGGYALLAHERAEKAKVAR